MECSLCGISDKMRNVSDALSLKGIIQVCSRCAQEEELITLKKPKVVEEQVKETMYKRMARLAGVKVKEQPRTCSGAAELQEKNLREIVDRNYEKKMKQEAIVLKPRPDLVDNFHWIIMSVRRIKGLTQGQLAERILESETAIKMAEQGVVPEGYDLIDKLERFLKIKLIKERNLALPIQRQQQHINQQLHQQKNEQPKQPINAWQKTSGFDKNVMDSLTIADLKKMKDEQKVNREEIDEKKDEYEQRRTYERLDYE